MSVEFMLSEVKIKVRSKKSLKIYVGRCVGLSLSTSFKFLHVAHLF